MFPENVGPLSNFYYIYHLKSIMIQPYLNIDTNLKIHAIV